ncbi:hypothetical protein BDN67DRAFT_985202 [Paxillus ammoniavirescens]|nr:hypothetical protein BDN67DRAFT_985202 [Paxillus ammoniavirescens]
MQRVQDSQHEFKHEAHCMLIGILKDFVSTEDVGTPVISGWKWRKGLAEMPLVPEQTRAALYWLYPGLLALHSSVLDSILSLPQALSQQENQPNTSVTTAVEGSCEENPIVLHGIIHGEFDYLLTLLFGGYAGEEHRQEFLVSVLKLLAFFEINHGYQYAIAELTCLLLLENSLKLQLGHLYHAHHMGLDYFYILSHTKAVVEENYRAIAYTEPNLKQPDGYSTQLQCTAVGKDKWWNGVAWQLLQDKLLGLLDKADIPGLCSLCKSPRFDIAVFEVMEIQTDEHIRRHIGSMAKVVRSCLKWFSPVRKVGSYAPVWTKLRSCPKKSCAPVQKVPLSLKKLRKEWKSRKKEQNLGVMPDAEESTSAKFDTSHNTTVFYCMASLAGTLVVVQLCLCNAVTALLAQDMENQHDTHQPEPDVYPGPAHH